MEGRPVLFELQRRERHGWTVVAIFGELDLSVVPRVRAALRDLVAPGARPGSGPPLRVLIDLGEVDFLDSAGLGVVLGAVRRIRSAGGVAVLIVAPSSSPAHLVQALDLGAVVPVAPSLPDAVAGQTIGAARIDPAALAAAAEAAGSGEGRPVPDPAPEPGDGPSGPTERAAVHGGTVLLDDGSAGDG
jgi:anti-sigma B factor antagonist